MIIGTHNGRFHTDDVFAIAILDIIYKEQKGEEFIVWRTRDPEMLAQCDMRVDVGEQYNEKTDFDHHQRGGAGVRENDIPYAAVGLIWKHFGKQLIDGKAWELIDESLIQPIDAHDNGVSIVELTNVIKPVTIDRIIDSFLPTWEEEQDFDSAFMRAVDFAKEFLKNKIRKTKAALKADAVVLKAIEEQGESPILILEQYVPHGKVVQDTKHILYVVHPGYGDKWMIKTARDDPAQFVNRKDLPKHWGGLSGEELETACGVKGAVFCHKNLFLAGAKTKDAVLQMAQLAVDNKD